MHLPPIHARHGLEFPLVGVDEDLSRRAKVLARVVRAHLAARLRAARRRQARVRYRYAAWATNMVDFRVQQCLTDIVQRSAKKLVRGCEKFVPALAYLFCLTLPGSCLARFAYLLADLCTFGSV